MWLQFEQRCLGSEADIDIDISHSTINDAAKVTPFHCIAFQSRESNLYYSLAR